MSIFQKISLFVIGFSLLGVLLKKCSNFAQKAVFFCLRWFFRSVIVNMFIVFVVAVNFKYDKAMINFENAFSYLEKDVREEGEPVIIPGGVGKYDVLLSPTEHLRIGSVRDCFDYVEVKVKKGDNVLEGDVLVIIGE